MTTSINIYTVDATTAVSKQFAVNFTLGFLSRDHVTAFVEDELDGSGNQIFRTITWINDGLVTLSGTLNVGDVVKIQRTTPADNLIHDFQAGAVLREGNLDEAHLQALMILHEVFDGRNINSFSSDLNMNAFDIENVGQIQTGSIIVGGFEFDPSTGVNIATPVLASAIDTASTGVTVQDKLDAFDRATYKRRVHKPFANAFDGSPVIIQDGPVDTFHRHFGGIAEGEDGRLHLFYRKAPEHALTANTEVIYVYSDNGGQTWSSESAIVAGVAGFDYRDFSVCVTPTGKVYVAYTKAPVPAGSPTTFETIYSIDNGVTWSIGPTIASINFAYARTFGRIKVIPGDADSEYRLLLTPYYQSSATPTFKIAAWYSEDDGDSWVEGAAIKDDTDSDSETDVAVLSPTVWLAISRSTAGLIVRKTLDSGATWSIVGTVPLTSTDSRVAPSVDVFSRDGDTYIVLGYCDRTTDEMIWRVALASDLLNSTEAFGAALVVATDMDNASGYQIPVIRPDGELYIEGGFGYVEFKEYVGQDYSQVRFVRSDIFNLLSSNPRSLIVASDAITVPDTFFDLEIRVGTEGGAGTDDLDTINGGREGQIVTFWSVSSSQDTTFKNGTGNLVLKGDYALVTVSSSITMVNHDGSWYELSRANDTAAPAAVLVISGGIVTAPSSERVTPLIVDTEASAATDDLDTINGGQDGQIVVCRTATGSRDVTYKDGVGNLNLAGDFIATQAAHTITLVKWGTFWYELSRSANG